MYEPEYWKKLFFGIFNLIFIIFSEFFYGKNKNVSCKNLFQNSGSHILCVLLFFKSTADSTCSVDGLKWHMSFKFDNYITFNVIIMFHQLLIPGKELIKATTWGSRYNNLPPVIYTSIRYSIPEGYPSNLQT